MYIMFNLYTFIYLYITFVGKSRSFYNIKILNEQFND